MSTIVHVAGWTLVHFAWQGVVIGAAAALALRALEHASSQSRYAVACLALGAMLAAPAATAWRLAAGDPPIATPLHRKVFVHVTPSGGTEHTTRTIVGVRHVIGWDRALPPTDGSGDAAAWMAAVVVVWLAGVCLLAARLAGGWWRVRRLHRAACRLAPSAWQSIAERVAVRLGVRRLVRVVDVSFVDGPLVIGWLRPVVLLPVAAVSGLTPNQVEAVLAHELAHVRRHDALVNACQTLAETLLFYHPAVWWTSSRIRIERENCCDDVALAATGDAVSYAAALAELERCRSGLPAMGMAATGGSLLARVTRLLELPAARRSRPGGIVTAALVAVFVIAGGALQLLVARQAPAPETSKTAPAWRMVFDHPSGEMVIRGFTARDLVRYAYQAPVSRIVGGPAWLDTDAFELATTVDHVPTADETPELVRRLLEERFALHVHESTVTVPVLALEIARPDGALGPNLQASANDCFDQQAWVASGAPRLPFGQGERTVMCGVWDDGIDVQRVRRITMDDLAASMRQRFAPAIPLDVVNRTGLEGAFDLSLEYFKPAAAAIAVTPALRLPLRAAGFPSVPEALEEQLGLTLVPATANAPAVVIDDIRRPLEGLLQP